MGFSNIRPKRSLGQNFFKNHNLAEYIVKQILKENPKTILEIGPGKGFFTQFFVQNNIKTICIEKDKELSEKLKDFLPQITLLNNDVLDIDVNKLIEKEDDLVCFGSLPYNVSKRIIFKLIEDTDIKKFYFIIQKEVGDKYVNKKKSSLLSLKTEIYVNSKILLNISPHNFVPRPNVESCLIFFKRDEKNINDINNFKLYLDRAFKQPRKKLKNNLNQFYNLDNIKEGLEKRAEDLDLAEHLGVFEKVKKGI